MKRILVICLTLLLLGCGASASEVQGIAANTMAVAVNDATGELLTRYEEEGNAAIDAAPTAEAARASLGKVRERWAPTWLALETFRIAHGAWVKALETGETPDLHDLAMAYCVVAVVADLPTKEFCP